MVELSQADQHLRRNIILSRFIFRIPRLGHAKIACNLLLCHICVFAEIADSLIHTITPPVVWHNLKQVIVF